MGENEEKIISINRGNRATIKLTSSKGKFKVGERLTFSVVDKKKYNNVVLEKEFIILEESNIAYITLTKEDTTIGEIISKEKEYWYEIKYSGDLTILGYDEDKAKKFILYPSVQSKGGN